MRVIRVFGFYCKTPVEVLDCEWAGAYRAQKLAEDPWFEARNYRVFPLPTGQGFIIKR